MLSYFLSSVQQEVFLRGFELLSATAVFWLPVILLIIFIQIWVRYIHADYISKQPRILLEIKLPKEITKSPLAMELVFTALHQTGNFHFVDAYYVGKVRPWFSFELASIGGQVKFFISTEARFRRLIEAQIYAQYPEVEIHEAEDYSLKVKHDLEKMIMWATYFKLTKADAYPIKTYIDYGLEENPKEEFKIDPMTSVLEYLGSLKAGEQTWIQIIIQGHKKEGLKDIRLFKKPFWDEAAKAEIQKIMDKLKSPDEAGGYRRPTKGEMDMIAAIERSVGKLPFETTIRGIYMAKKESFNPIGITGLIGSFRQYSSNNLNGFKLGKFSDFDYPWWQDFRRVRRTAIERKMLDAYKRRSFFHPPYKYYRQKPFILTTEELATIYHFPGSVASTPTIEKTMSKKSEPPANLPI